MRETLSLVAAGIALLAGRSDAYAVTFQLEPIVSAAYDETFSPLPSVPPFSAGVPGIYQIDLHVRTTNLAPGELGFAAVGFHVDWSAATDPGIGFVVNDTPIDTNGALPGGVIVVFPPPLIPPMLPPNTYFVSTPANLAINHPVARVGQPGGISLIGSLFVQWDGASGPTLLTLDNISFGAYSTAGELLFQVNHVDVPISVIPEPATFGSCLFAAIAVAALHRRRG